MLGQETSPQNGALQAQVKQWAGKFIALKVALSQAGNDIKWMLPRAPAELRQEIAHLEKRQSELERSFFDIEGRLLSMAQAWGISIPGLSGLGDNPITLLASAARLYFDAWMHIQRVTEYRDRLEVEGIIPAKSTWAGQPLWLWGIGAFLLYRMLR